jgi:hypothetical protein
MNHITIIVALAFGLFLAASLATTNTIVYAQQVPSSSSHSSPTLHLQGPSVKLHAVKIAFLLVILQHPIAKYLLLQMVQSRTNQQKVLDLVGQQIIQHGAMSLVLNIVQ